MYEPLDKISLPDYILTTFITWYISIPRYEWSAGLTKQDEPEGIFEDPDDDVWHHAGQTNQAIYNLKRGACVFYNLLRRL